VRSATKTATSKAPSSSSGCCNYFLLVICLFAQTSHGKDLAPKAPVYDGTPVYESAAADDSTQSNDETCNASTSALLLASANQGC